jgi:metal transporter CNNM
VKEGRDPTHRVVGIVTLEDIIEEIIQDEIVDEFEMFDDKQHRWLMKQRLVKLFTDHRAETALSKDELNAIVQYLEKYIGAFHPSKLKPNSLSKLIRKSAVLEIESDNVYFSHNLD